METQRDKAVMPNRRFSTRRLQLIWIPLLWIALLLACESGPSSTSGEDEAPSSPAPYAANTVDESSDDESSPPDGPALDPGTPPSAEVDDELIADLQFACEKAGKLIRSYGETEDRQQLKRRWYQAVLDDQSTSTDFRAMASSLERLVPGDQFAQFSKTIEIAGGPDNWTCPALRTLFPSRNDVQKAVNAECDQLERILDSTSDEEAAWTQSLETARSPDPNGVIMQLLKAHRDELQSPEMRRETIEQFREIYNRELSRYDYLESCGAAEQLLDSI